MDDKSIRSRASQDTFVSLLQLDPEPMDNTNTTPDLDKELPPVPEERLSTDRAPSSSSGSSPEKSSPPSGPTCSTPSNSTTSLGLRGSAHGPIWYLSRVQRYSSYTFTIFATVHLATTSIIPLATRSVPASESYLLLAREIYQTRLSEPLLVTLPIIAHVASGIALRLLRRKQNLARYGGATPGVDALHHRPRHSKTSSGSASPPPAWRVWPPLSYISASGYVFAAAISAHAFVNRVLPLLVEGDSANIALAYTSHGFARHSVLSSVAFMVLLGAGCGHMVWGWAKWLGFAQRADSDAPRPTGNNAVDKAVKRSRRRTWLAIQGAAVGAMLLWAAGGLGVVARGGSSEGWVGKVYDSLYEKVWM